MNKFLKLVSTALTTVMLVGTLAGCGGKKSADKEGKETVTVWVHPFMKDQGEEQKMWQSFVKSFEDKNQNIKVDLQTVPWANRDQRLLTAFSAGKGPDVVYLITDHLAQFGTMGIIEPLDKYVTEDIKKDFPEKILKGATVDGKLYGIPMLQTVMAYNYNLDLLQKAGWDTKKLPETWEDLMNMSKMVKEKTGAYGMAMTLGNTPNSTYYPYLWQAGGNVINDKGEYTLDSEAGKKSLQFMRDLYANKYVPEDAATALTEHDALFQEGKIAMILSENLPSVFKELSFKYDVGPALKNKEQVLFGTLGSWALAHNSQNKDAAAKFILHLTSAENMKTFLTNTKYIPPRTSLGDMYKDDPYLNKVTKLAEFVRPGVVHPAGRSILSLLNPEIQAVVLGQKTPEKAISDAKPKVEKAVKDSLDLKPQ